MNVQKLIYDLVKNNNGEGQDLAFIKYVSQSSLIQNEIFPALYIEDDKVITFQAGQKQAPVYTDKNFALLYVIESEAMNEMDEERYSTLRTELENQSKIIVDFINSNLENTDKVSSVKIGQGTVYDLMISGRSCMGIEIPLTIKSIY